ncbi:MAG: hypothetical protein WA004_01045 [Saprospiraceae bacterium]
MAFFGDKSGAKIIFSENAPPVLGLWLPHIPFFRPFPKKVPGRALAAGGANVIMVIQIKKVLLIADRYIS